MAKTRGNFPLGRSEKLNVAVQRPLPNVKEIENLGEQAAAAARKPAPEITFSKHGTFGPPQEHAVESLFKD